MQPERFSFHAIMRITPVYLSIVVLYINIFALPPVTVALIRETGLGHFQAGLLMTVYTVVYCVGNIFTGILSDRYGPKSIMITGLLAGYLCSLLFTLTDSFAVMLFTRVCLGFSAAAMTSPSLMYLYGWLPPEKRSMGVSGQLASLTLGSALVFLITPILMRSYPWRSLLTIYALVGLVVLGALWILCKDPRREGSGEGIGQSPGAKARKGDKAGGILSPVMLLLSGVLFVALFQIGGTLTWLAPWLEEKCRFAPWEIGLGAMSFSLFGIPSTLMGGFLVARLGPGRISRIASMSMIGMLVSASMVAFIVLESTHLFGLILLVIVLARFGSFMFVGSLLSLVPKLVKPGFEGKAVGVVNAIAMAGGFFASLLAGYIVEETSQYHLVWIIFALALIVSAIVLHPLLGKALAGTGDGKVRGEKEGNK
ncbi:MAG TPA: MFS transporter [Spirochaetia bacterium]|nr:MFS transporter [Spirochaetia bacterium]